jgi:hypothetical protein
VVVMVGQLVGFGNGELSLGEWRGGDKGHHQHRTSGAEKPRPCSFDLKERGASPATWD